MSKTFSVSNNFFFLNHCSSHTGWIEDDRKLPKGLKTPFVFWSSKYRFYFILVGSYSFCMTIAFSLVCKTAFLFFVDIWPGATLCPAKRIVHSGQSIVTVFLHWRCFLTTYLRIASGFFLNSSFTLLNFKKVKKDLDHILSMTQTLILKFWVMKCNLGLGT